GRGAACREFLTRGREADARQELVLPQLVGDEPRDHAHTGGAEAPVPAEARAAREVAADERAKEAAQIDAHVEDREASIATRVALLVELADHRRDVRLEEPG